ncbi:Uncharacterised protein [uncultured archaeon]|nr:Uncharacterised protein [uncultured archaeon]
MRSGSLKLACTRKVHGVRVHQGNWKRVLMEYLTVSKILEIHDEIIKEYGGTGGLRDEGTLELLVYKAPW